jgi:hypothetical protein
MMTAAEFDAKMPTRRFRSDVAEKQASATVDLRAAAEAVRPAYESLVTMMDQHRGVAVS